MLKFQIATSNSVFKRKYLKSNDKVGAFVLSEWGTTISSNVFHFSVLVSVATYLQVILTQCIRLISFALSLHIKSSKDMKTVCSQILSLLN